MANELRTDFIFSERDAFQKIDLLQNKLESVDKKLNSLGGAVNFGGTVTTQINKLTQPVDNLIAKAQADIKRMQVETVRGEREITKSVEREAKLQADARIREQRRAANEFLRTLNEVNKPQKGAGTSGLGSGLGELGFGSALGAAGVVAGAGAFASASVTAAREAANAQRLLQATTKETGLAYSRLTAEAAEFGRVTLQSNAAAQSSFAQIVTFANAAGRTDKLEQFRKAFADLAAARGIDPSELGDIARQLNALTDEATDKLLGANPSAFYDKFAKSVGTTAEKLTDAQKRAAVFDEVLRRGAIFTGEAEKRLNASASALDRMSVKYANFKESIGNVLLGPIQVAEQTGGFIDRILRGTGSNNELVKTVNNSILTLPIRPLINITDAATQTIFSYITGEREALIKLKFVDENIKSILEAARAAQALRESDEKIRAAKANPLGSLENFALSRVNLAAGFFDEKKRKEAIEQATKEANDFVANLKRRLEGAMRVGNVDLLKQALQEFQRYQMLFDADTRLGIAESLTKAISDGAARGFQDAIKSAKDNVPRLRQILAQVNLSADLNVETRNSIGSQITEQINQAIESGKNKVKELGKTITDTFDDLFQKQFPTNPFVAIFSEADKSLTKLRENLRGASPELQALGEKMLAQQNSLRLFEARLDNRLGVADLRDRADELRSFRPKEFKIEDPNKFFEEFTAAQIKKLSEATGGSFLAFDKLVGGGTIQRDLRETVNTVFERIGGLSELSKIGDERLQVSALKTEGGFFRRTRTFQDLTELEKQQHIESLSKTSDSDLAFQDRLRRRLTLVEGNKFLSPEEQAINDRKLLALSSGIDPSRLEADLREKFALANEREAERRERYEEEARNARKEQIKIQTSIDTHLSKLREIAEKEGLSGINELLIKFESNDPAATAQKRTVPTPTPEDTARIYQEYQSALNP